MEKVFVNCPTADMKQYCLNDYVTAVNALTYPSVKILLADNSKTDTYRDKIADLGLPVIRTPWSEIARKRIVDARNALRNCFLQSDCTWFFSLEQDVLAPPNAIEKLLSHGEKIVSGIYLNPQVTPEGIVRVPVLWKDITQSDFENALKYPVYQLYIKEQGITTKEEMQQNFTYEEVRGNHFLQAKACGLGVVMIHRSVLELISFRYEPDVIAFDDVFFSLDCVNSGFKIFADTSVKCKHAIQSNQWKNIKK